MKVSSTDLSHAIRQRAADLGFDDVRVTGAHSIADAGHRLMTFLEAGYHGDMLWMADTAERRKSPTSLWPDARSIVMLAMNYGPDEDPLKALAAKDRGVISAYAKGKDYHDIIKGRLKQLARFIAEETGEGVKVFVDTAPLMEKPLAQAAGIGWQGKHTNLVSKNYGSWLFLGAIVTRASLPTDDGEVDHCGSCQECLDICPTNAFPNAYQLDARRCIAYLTIEHQGHIAREFRQPMGNRVFGCDDCLAVCPWNKFASLARETRFAARVETDNPDLSQLLTLDDAAFRKQFAGTPVKRTGRDRFLRNCLIAAGNSGARELVPLVVDLLNDGSALVRAMAVWASQALMEADEFDALKRTYLVREQDADVLSEWQTAVCLDDKAVVAAGKRPPSQRGNS